MEVFQYRSLLRTIHCDPLGIHSHNRGDEPHGGRTQSDEQITTLHSPCEADNTIIDVYEAKVGRWYADVQEVDDKLATRIRTHSVT